MRTLTIGTFDTPHAGHATLLKRCAELGGVIVGLNTDQFVEEYKHQRPLFTYEEREQLLKPLCDQVLPNKSAGKELINIVRPDYLVIGSDWASRDYYAQIDVTQQWLDERNIVMVYVPYTQGISTTEIKKRCKQ